MTFVNRTTPYLPVEEDGGGVLRAKFDRTIFRTSARVPWGPLWVRRLCPMLVSIALLDDHGNVEFRANPLLRRHAPSFKLQATWERCCLLLRQPRPFDGVAAAGHMRDVCYELCTKLKLENSSNGPVLVFVGDVVDTLRPWPEDVSDMEAKTIVARALQRLARGAQGRIRARQRRDALEAQSRARIAAERMREAEAREAAAAEERERVREREQEAARMQEEAAARACAEEAEREGLERKRQEELTRRAVEEEARLREEEATRRKLKLEEEARARESAAKEQQRREEEAARAAELEREALRNEGVLIGDARLQGTLITLRIQVQKGPKVSILATDGATGRTAAAVFTGEKMGLEDGLFSIPPSLELFDAVARKLDLFYSKKKGVMVLALRAV